MWYIYHVLLIFLGTLAHCSLITGPRPDHPRDPAGYCQTCNGTTAIVGSPTTCIQNRVCLSLAMGADSVTCRGLRINVMVWNRSLNNGWMRSVRRDGSSDSHSSGCLCAPFGFTRSAFEKVEDAGALPVWIIAQTIYCFYFFKLNLLSMHLESSNYVQEQTLTEITKAKACISSMACLSTLSPSPSERYTGK